MYIWANLCKSTLLYVGYILGKRKKKHEQRLDAHSSTLLEASSLSFVEKFSSKGLEPTNGEGRVQKWGISQLIAVEEGKLMMNPWSLGVYLRFGKLGHILAYLFIFTDTILYVCAVRLSWWCFRNCRWSYLPKKSVGCPKMRRKNSVALGWTNPSMNYNLALLHQECKEFLWKISPREIHLGHTAFLRRPFLPQEITQNPSCPFPKGNIYLFILSKHMCLVLLSCSFRGSYQQRFLMLGIFCTIFESCPIHLSGAPELWILLHGCYLTCLRTKGTPQKHCEEAAQGQQADKHKYGCMGPRILGIWGLCMSTIPFRWPGVTLRAANDLGTSHPDGVLEVAPGLSHQTLTGKSP